MKKLFAFFTLLLVSVVANATEFKEGTAYKVLDLPHSTTPVVTEFFSFYCPHCYEFELLLKEIKTKLPEGTRFEKNHVSFMGSKMGFTMNKAYATMVELHVDDKLTPVFFNHIHRERKYPKDVETLKQWFVDAGVDGQQFDNTFSSFATDSMAREFDILFQKAKLTGVPAIIVNSKYEIIPGGIDSLDEYIKLINYLLTK